MSPVADTVQNAAATPDREQPYAALGLKPDEYAKIREILGRRPTSGELAMYSVMWSEHCSYKSSKIYLKQFGSKTTEAMRKNLMVGMGENAGVIDVGEGWAVTFKIESHNHPSYIEPFQGAATGVGGIVRDIISMGARPVAVMDALRFGAIDDPDTARVVHGVVNGISFYGNCLGLPNIGGETWFDPVYQANPLVNALAVGVLRHEDLHLANARGAGNKVVLFGARTGGDGIGGASILASDSFSAGGPTKRPAVQVGDPFAEKVLIECCLELFALDLVEGIQDLGAAGISCATSELASNGDGGMFVELDKVLLRDPTLTAEEILMSESQERMMAIVRPEKLEGFLEVVGKWDVETSVLGEVTDSGRLVINWHGEEIVNVDPRTVAVDGPVYERPVAYPTWIDALQADTASTLASSDRRRRAARAGAAPARQPEPQRQALDHQPVRPLRDGQHRAELPRRWRHGARRRGVRPRLRGRDRRQRTLLPARPLPRRAARARRGVPQRGRDGRDPGRRLRLPQLRLPGEPRGHVAVQPRGRGSGRWMSRARDPRHRRQRLLLQPDRRRAHPPDPVVAVLGVIADVARRIPSGWQDEGNNIYLLGETKLELDGSAWAGVIHDHLGGMPPEVHFAAEQKLAALITAGSEQSLIASAHDLADGGLGQALAEAVLRFGVGARVWLSGIQERDGVDAATALFSESTARVLVSVPREDDVRFVGLCEGRGVPYLRIGVTDSGAGAVLEVQDLFSVGLEELQRVHRGALVEAFGAAVSFAVGQ